MTKEQKEKALVFLKDMQECTYDGVEEIRTAIECLEQPTSDDCVSRQAVINEIKSMSNANPSYWNHCDVVDRENLIDGIKALPPVTPTFPKGATNGDMLTALFGKNALITLDTHNYLKDWWNALYKEVEECK